ncbi:MAG: ATP-binding protein, partial [Gemmatimonadales bacterium]
GKDPRFETTLRETAQRILTEIDRLDGIARAFSRFGAPEAAGAGEGGAGGGERERGAGSTAAPLEPVDLAAAAREVVQLYRLGSATRFEVRAGPDGAFALARTDEVKEVLGNLLENARNADATRVTIRITARGRRLVVTDNGRGVAPEALPRVFEPTFSTTSSGAGLGLAIARRLVESWGGAITLDSAPGEGTTVTLTLQAAPPGAGR